MVFLMKVKLLFSAALAQSVSPVLWGNRGLLWPGVAVGGVHGAGPGGSLSARQGYGDTWPMLWQAMGLVLAFSLACLAACRKVWGSYLPPCPWSLAEMGGWRMSCLPQSDAGSVLTSCCCLVGGKGQKRLLSCTTSMHGCRSALDNTSFHLHHKGLTGPRNDDCSLTFKLLLVLLMFLVCCGPEPWLV